MPIIDRKESVAVLQECMDLQLKKSKDYQSDSSNITQAMHYRRGVDTIHDIIIGKIMPIKNNPEYKYRDCSTSIRSNETGYLDDNYIDRNSEGYRFAKTKLRSIRIPEIGDKLSSRHGQKGTIGMTYQQKDMPFTKDGITPDIIINPHAIPSRMTIAQLIECILGKACSILGYEGDGTGFNNTNVNDVIDILQSCGYEGMGNEVLYSGITGEQLKTKIFMGPTYYQKLKHMSSDKIHSRAGGPIVSMTRQPAEGRSSHGGLRFGEMERDCIISHGASAVLRERLFEQSDPFITCVCTNCGLLCEPEAERMQVRGTSAYCRNCDSRETPATMRMPYAFKLLLQELYAMNIAPRLRLNISQNEELVTESFKDNQE